MRIVFATNNQGKIKEIKEILKDSKVDVLTLSDLGIHSDPEENGSTFAENARIKVVDVYNRLKTAGELDDTIIMADDSGLCIDCLNGDPGVKSARFMGHDTPYTEKNKAILALLKDVPWENRGAAFVCHICAVTPEGRFYDAESRMEGAIAQKPEGTEGFGYDPIFYVPEYGKVSGLLTPEQKNSVSHRGKVLRKMRDILCQDHLL